MPDITHLLKQLRPKAIYLLKASPEEPQRPVDPPPAKSITLAIPVSSEKAGQVLSSEPMDNVMYFWKEESESWCYQIRFFGKLLTGTVNDRRDRQFIGKLNTLEALSAEGDVTEKFEFYSRQKLSICYLNLGLSEQDSIAQLLPKHLPWLFSDAAKTNEKLSFCNGFLYGKEEETEEMSLFMGKLRREFDVFCEKYDLDPQDEKNATKPFYTILRSLFKVLKHEFKAALSLSNEEHSPCPVAISSDTSVDKAYSMLKLKYCYLLQSRDTLPSSLSDNAIYVWEDKESHSWIYCVDLLGHMYIDSFDRADDVSIYNALRTLQAHQLVQHVTPLIGEQVILQMSEVCFGPIGYQKMLVHQLQAIWPFDVTKFSSEQIINICLSIIEQRIVIGATSNLNAFIETLRVQTFLPVLAALHLTRDELNNEKLVIKLNRFVHQIFSMLARAHGLNEKISPIHYEHFSQYTMAFTLLYKEIFSKEPEYIRSIFLTYYARGPQGLEVKNFVEMLRELDKKYPCISISFISYDEEDSTLCGFNSTVKIEAIVRVLMKKLFEYASSKIERMNFAESRFFRNFFYEHEMHLPTLLATLTPKQRTELLTLLNHTASMGGSHTSSRRGSRSYSRGLSVESSELESSLDVLLEFSMKVQDLEADKGKRAMSQSLNASYEPRTFLWVMDVLKDDPDNAMFYLECLGQSLFSFEASQDMEVLLEVMKKAEDNGSLQQKIIHQMFQYNTYPGKTVKDLSSLIRCLRPEMQPPFINLALNLKLINSTNDVCLLIAQCDSLRGLILESVLHHDVLHNYDEIARIIGYLSLDERTTYLPLIAKRFARVVNNHIELQYILIALTEAESKSFLNLIDVGLIPLLQSFSRAPSCMKFPHQNVCFLSEITSDLFSFCLMKSQSAQQRTEAIKEALKGCMQTNMKQETLFKQVGHQRAISALLAAMPNYDDNKLIDKVRTLLSTFPNELVDRFYEKLLLECTKKIPIKSAESAAAYPGQPLPTLSGFH